MRPRRSISPALATGAPIRNYLRFHTGAPISDRKDAAFALGDWEALAPLSDYPLGSDGYPDRSATLIFELPALNRHGRAADRPWHPHSMRSCRYRRSMRLSPMRGIFHAGWISSSPAAMRSRRCRVRHVWRRADVCGGERRRARHRGGGMTGSRASGAEIRRLRKSASTRSAKQMALAVDRVMAEGSLYDPDLAALGAQARRAAIRSRRSS